MINRIKELRKKKGLSQKELAQEFNKFTLTNSTSTEKTPTYATFSRWEKGLNTPTTETWNKLAKFFNVSVEYLQGAYSKEEILKMLQRAYITFPHYDNYHQIRTTVAFNVDLIMIAYGYIEADTPELVRMLSPEDYHNLNFWKKHFSFIFDSVAVNWLVTRPIEVSEDDVLKAINEALEIKISQLSTDTNTERKNEYGEYLESPSHYLAQRQEFINNHITEDGTVDF